MPGAFPTIGGYGFLSDCHTSALVSFDGTVEWLCLPRFDSPSVFAAVLDRGAGRLSLRPRGVVVPISRRYIPGTLVVETTWGADTGWVVVHDALSIASWTPYEGGPIVSHDSDQSLVRTIKCIDGEADLEMDCLPRFGYGRGAPAWSDGEGAGEAPGAGERIARGEDGTVLELRTDFELVTDGAAALRLLEGEHGWRPTAGRDWRRNWGATTSPPIGAPRRSSSRRRSARGAAATGSSASTTTPMRSTPRCR